MRMPATLTEEIAQLANSGGLAVIVGTRDAHLVPELVRAWGVRVGPSRDQLELCVPMSSGRRTLANIADNRQVAVTLTMPTTYRSFQVKGDVLETTTPSPDDRERVTRHYQAFASEVAALGLSIDRAAQLFEADLKRGPDMMKIRVAIDALFDQTPGPGAGSRL
jgi:hypothetical protein